MSEDSDGHIVTKLALKNGETYVLDLAGAQFGHFDPVMPWQDYVECRASEIEKTVFWPFSLEAKSPMRDAGLGRCNFFSKCIRYFANGAGT